MPRLLNSLEAFRRFRLLARLVVVIPWQVVGWWTILVCFKSSPARLDAAQPDILARQT
jgi:hypothetical protein